MQVKSSHFFPDVTASICGVPEKLISNLNIIYGVLASGFEVDVPKFRKLCEETEQIYFDENVGVGWYNITPTLHRIFKHSAEVIQACPLPIGLTTEEGSESNNKNIRRFRFQHSRSTSWFHSIKDVYDRIMDISDPKIQDTAASRRANSRKKRSLPKEVLAILKEPEILPDMSDDEMESD